MTGLIPEFEEIYQGRRDETKQSDHFEIRKSYNKVG